MASKWRQQARACPRAWQRKETVVCKRSLWTVSGAGALAVLVALGAAGLWLGAPTTERTAVRIPVAEIATSMMPQDDPLTPQQQQLLNLIPPGYPAGSCQPSNNPPALPDTVASLDCFNNSRPGGPTTARYELFPDQDTLNNQWQIDVNHAALQTCPENQASPGDWNFNSDPNSVAGLVMCFNVNNTPDVEWSNNKYLTIADTQGNDMAGLYQWWKRLP
jgi:serine/threonine kinase PknH